ncbi:hypothetical protein D9M68_735830 [compost metagenome]
MQIAQGFLIQLRQDASADQQGKQGDLPTQAAGWPAQVNQGRQQQRRAGEAAVAGIHHQGQHHHRSGKARRDQPPTATRIEPVEQARAPAVPGSQHQDRMGQDQQVQAKQCGGPQPFADKAAGYPGQFTPQADAGHASCCH